MDKILLTPTMMETWRSVPVVIAAELERQNATGGILAITALPST